jgi:3-hydroxybutyryl-CoA dehydratase
LNPLSTILGDIQLGHHFSPLVYRFSEELIYKYADAVDDFNLFHRDPVKASSGPFGGIIAPPALASLFVLKAYRTDWSPPEGGIQREQKFSFFAPIRPGDIITIRAEITPKGKKNENCVLTFTSYGQNQKGEIVVLSESTSVWGFWNKKVEKHQSSNTNHVKNRAVVIRDDPVSVIEKWDIGDSLPTLTKKILREKIGQYEEILGIGNPIHFDEEYAKTTPFKGVIAHGLMSVAYCLSP